MKNKKSQSKLTVPRDNTTLGYFTGTYTSKSVTNDIPKYDRLNEIIFLQEFKNVSSEESSLDNLYTSEKITIGLNGLPLVGAMLNKVGHYGLVFAPALRLCQYYKKKAPSLIL